MVEDVHISLHVLLITLVQTQHVCVFACVCVKLYLIYMSKSRVKCYVWDETEESTEKYTHAKNTHPPQTTS